MSETKNEKVVTKELNYSVKEMVHPEYKMSRVLTQNGSQTVSLSLSSSSESLFELPTKVFNFAKSKLKFNILYSQPAAYVWRWADNLAPIFGIQLYTRGGEFIMNVSQGLPNYLSFARKAQTKFSDYETFASTDGLYKSNKPVDTLVSSATVETKFVSGAGTDAIYTSTVSASTSSQNYRTNDTLANLNYLENTYAVANTTSNTTTAAQLTDYYEISLDAFKDTILSLDKDITFPEIIYMKILWNRSTAMAWNGASATNPNTTATAWAGDATINGLQLYLAIEKNASIVSSVVSKLKNGGLPILFPQLIVNKTSLTGTSQSLSTRLNSGNGISLKKAITVPFHATESVTTSFDHSNITSNTDGTPTKVTSFYTQLNNERQQEFDIDCSANVDLDWMAMFNKLKGSVIMSKNIYKYNWFFEESFEHIQGQNDEKNVDDQNVITGLSLEKEIKYDFYATVPIFNTTSPLIWWSYFVVNRMLHITSDKIVMK